MDFLLTPDKELLSVGGGCLEIVGQAACVAGQRRLAALVCSYQEVPLLHRCAALLKRSKCAAQLLQKVRRNQSTKLHAIAIIDQR